MDLKYCLPIHLALTVTTICVDIHVKIEKNICDPPRQNETLLAGAYNDI